MKRRSCDAAPVAISAGELRRLIAAAVEDGIRRAKTRPAKRPPSGPDGEWSPAVALADLGLRVSR